MTEKTAKALAFFHWSNTFSLHIYTIYFIYIQTNNDTGRLVEDCSLASMPHRIMSLTVGKSATGNSLDDPNA